MTDNKNTILAIALSAIVLIAWQYFFAVPQEKVRQEQQQQQQQKQPAPAGQTAQPAQPSAQPGAPQLHDNAPNNVVFVWPVGDKAGTEAAFKDAEVIVKQRIVNHRLIPNPMEVRGDIGLYNPGTDEYTIWMSSQTPHIQRLLLAAFVMGIPEHKIRCISPDVGGAFGSKGSLAPEHAVASPRPFAVEPSMPICLSPASTGRPADGANSS